MSSSTWTVYPVVVRRPAPSPTTGAWLLERFAPVTYKEAKALGLKFRAQKAGGPNAVWVEVTFDAKGKLEGVKRVTLACMKGRSCSSTPP